MKVPFSPPSGVSWACGGNFCIPLNPWTASGCSTELKPLPVSNLGPSNLPFPPQPMLPMGTWPSICCAGLPCEEKQGVHCSFLPPKSLSLPFLATHRCRPAHLLLSVCSRVSALWAGCSLVHCPAERQIYFWPCGGTAQQCTNWKGSAQQRCVPGPMTCPRQTASRSCRHCEILTLLTLCKDKKTQTLCSPPPAAYKHCFSSSHYFLPLGRGAWLCSLTRQGH